MKEGHPEKQSTLGEPGSGLEASRPAAHLGRTQRTDPDLPASELGNYRLLSWLGGGGMGQVFLAEHRQLGRKVALKVLRKELAHSPDVVRRFVHEAQLVNQIRNEHIVDIHDFGEGPDGLEYFVMELLVGKDLARAREEDGPFPLARTLDIVRQVGSALVAVHSHKIIHRDLKPENIFLAERGSSRDFVKLLDFGLAKLTEAAPGAADGTAIGTLIGTPLYMSPEQTMGLRVDWRADIFALGLIVYWMLFDKLPQEGDDLEAIRRLRMEQPISVLPSRTAAGEPVPPEVAATVVGCLTRKPAERIQTVAEVLARLPEPAPNVPELQARPGPSYRRPAKAAAVGMALATAAVALYLALRPTGEADVLPQPAATPAAELSPLPTLELAAPHAPAPLADPAPVAPARAHAEPSPGRKRTHPARHRPADEDEGEANSLLDPFSP
ncbi:MAG: serine/threonine-protein kinase [Myxococcales bacterium]